MLQGYCTSKLNDYPLDGANISNSNKKIAPFGAEFLNQLEARAEVKPTYMD
jgi:hypothetical protein